jgi:hypothetical protein
MGFFAFLFWNVFLAFSYTIGPLLILGPSVQQGRSEYKPLLEENKVSLAASKEAQMQN